MGRSNKPGINKAAQAEGKNCRQNILDAGALVIQRSTEEVTREVTGKVQKQKYQDTRQFVSYSSGGEGYFIGN